MNNTIHIQAIRMSSEPGENVPKKYREFPDIPWTLVEKRIRQYCPWASEEDIEIAKIRTGNGTRTPNEALTELGAPPLEGQGDRPVVTEAGEDAISNQEDAAAELDILRQQLKDLQAPNCEQE